LYETSKIGKPIDTETDECFPGAGRREGIGSDCLMGSELPFGMSKKVWDQIIG
jgi:hypothetical protein